jgi:hypothetical protein
MANCDGSRVSTRTSLNSEAFRRTNNKRCRGNVHLDVKLPCRRAHNPKPLSQTKNRSPYVGCSLPFFAAESKSRFLDQTPFSRSNPLTAPCSNDCLALTTASSKGCHNFARDGRHFAFEKFKESSGMR